MIKFFIRLIIFLMAIVFTVGFTSGLNSLPLVGACVFVSAWITIVPFKDIFWWIFAFSVMFGIGHYDSFGFCVASIVSVAILFDQIYSYAVRTSNDNFFILYIASVVLAIVAVVIVELIQYHHVFISSQSIIFNSLVSLGLFFIFRFMIRRAERFIDLYTHGTDMRCHT